MLLHVKQHLSLGVMQHKKAAFAADKYVAKKMLISLTYNTCTLPDRN